ncbi:MAG: AAA family ATPase [bacterium]|nr:AAA family ATPase [bacterium]
MPSLIILRGLPGSGKSTLSGILAENDNWPVFSIDDYFTDSITGSYAFRYRDNHLAYQWCENETEKAMVKKTEKIFIDNAFTLEWELEPYFALAKKHDYAIFVVTVENRHQGTNSHEVSEDQLKKMAEKYKVVLY